MMAAGMEACTAAAVARGSASRPDQGSWESFAAGRRIALSPEDTMSIIEEVRRLDQSGG